MPSLAQEIFDQILYRTVDTVEDDCSYLDRHRDWSRAYLINQAFDFRRVCKEWKSTFDTLSSKHARLTLPSRRRVKYSRAAREPKS